MISTHDTQDDLCSLFRAYPADEISCCHGYFPLQNLISIFCTPNDMELETEDCVRTFSIVCDHEKRLPYRGCRLKSRAITLPRRDGIMPIWK